MQEEEFVWAAATGGFAVLAVIAAGNAISLRTWPAARLACWVLLYGLWAFVVSGIASLFFPVLTGELLRLAQMGMSTLMVSASLYLFRFTAESGLRSRWLDWVLNLSSLGLPVVVLAMAGAAPAVPWVAWANAVIYAAALLAGLLVLLVGFREGETALVLGGLMVLVTLPFDFLLHARAMGYPLAVDTQALVACMLILKAMAVGFSLQPREDRQRNARHRARPDPGLDATTRLYNGRRMVQKIVRAQHVQRWTGARGVVVALRVRDYETLSQRHGGSLVNALMVNLGARIELQAGYINPVGRYGTDCFLVLVSAISSPASLQFLLRSLAAKLSEPVVFRTPYPGESTAIDPMFPSLGMAWMALSPGLAVDALLDRLLQQARHTDLAVAASWQVAAER